MKKNYLLSMITTVCMLLLPCILFAQGSIRGTVTDAETGEPLAAVNIVIAGTEIGTPTNSDGEYELNGIEAGNYRVEARFVGYETMTKSVTVEDGQTSVVDFEFSFATTQMDDVVVTALGISRAQRSIGYSTQEVSGENLTLANEKNVIGSLAGKIAGVHVVGSSGASMGGTNKIQIRGVNSISGASPPLIVVDGTPISNANYAGHSGRDYGNISQDVNPEDIESVNVLKGPAASALYGIRGQYGVIMITTNKGAKGAEKFTVELNTGFQVERVANIMPYQNEYGAGSSQTFSTLPNGDPYVSMIDESWGPRMDGTLVRHHWSFYPQDPNYGELAPFDPQPDNIKDFFETGINFSQGVTVSGGGENSNIRLSFNNTDIQGIEPNTFLKRNNLGLSAGIDLSDKWNVSTNLNYARNNAQRPSQGVQQGSRYFGEWFERNLDMNRLKDYKYEDGTILHWNLRPPSSSTGEITNFSPLYFNNPYFDAYENPAKDNRDRFFGDLGVTYDVLSELSISAFIRSDMYVQNFESRSAFGGTGTPGYSTTKYQNREMNYELLAQYDNRWDEFSLNANIGANVYERFNTYHNQSTAGGLTAPGFYNIDASIDPPNANSSKLEKKVVSAFGLVSLGYMDTYFIDASLRNDKSSALPADNNSYWYPSVSGSLVFSELTDLDALSFGKLRFSYAQAGSDLDPYQTTRVYGVGTSYGSISTLSVPNTYRNTNIKPSFAHSYEAGIDLNFFERLGVEFTYYQQKNENQIINLDISGSSGYSATTINAGLIENSGIELSLTGSPIQTTNFLWDASFNISRNKSSVVELYPGIDVYQYESRFYSCCYTYLNSYEGQPFGSIVGKAYERDEATGKILLGSNNIPLYTESTHDFGSAMPDFTGGLQNTFRFRNFELAAMIDFQIGGQFFSRTQSLADRVGLSKKSAATNDLGNNVRDPILDQDGNTVGTVSAENAGSGSGGVKVSGISETSGEEVTAYVNPRTYYGTVGNHITEEYIYDSSYIKLREIRVGYSLDNALINRLPLESARLSITARNPLMIWQDAPEGLDPSQLSTGSQSISWYESGQLNTVRSIGIDINITF